MHAMVMQPQKLSNPKLYRTIYQQISKRNIKRNIGTGTQHQLKETIDRWQWPGIENSMYTTEIESKTIVENEVKSKTQNKYKFEARQMENHCQKLLQ